MSICIEDGCPEPVEKGTRCPLHERERRAKRTRQFGTWKSPTTLTTGRSRWRTKVRPAILKRDRHRCAYCGAHATSVDHVVPPSSHDGHSWNYRNLVAACARCQSVKQARTPEEAGLLWPRGRGLYASGKPHPLSGIRSTVTANG